VQHGLQVAKEEGECSGVESQDVSRRSLPNRLSARHPLFSSPVSLGSGSRGNLVQLSAFTSVSASRPLLELLIPTLSWIRPAKRARFMKYQYGYPGFN
jgi:hypothetical protein